LVEDLDQPGKISARPGQPVDLVNDIVNAIGKASAGVVSLMRPRHCRALPS
jgi:hypothetical protein